MFILTATFLFLQIEEGNLDLELWGRKGRCTWIRTGIENDAVEHKLSKSAPWDK